MHPIQLGPHGRLPFARVFAVDTETTGLAPWGWRDGEPSGDPDGPDRLCSLCLVEMSRDAAGAWRRDMWLPFLFDPGRPVPEGAARVNGFAWSLGQPVAEGRTDLAGAPPFRASAAAIAAILEDTPLVFHHAAFDAAVLDAEFVRAGLPPIRNPVLCTKKAFSEIQGLGRPDAYVRGTNLNALCDRLGVDRSSRIAADGAELHGAAVDAGLAADCFARLEPLGWMLAEAAAAQPHRRAGWTRRSPDEVAAEAAILTASAHGPRR